MLAQDMKFPVSGSYNLPAVKVTLILNAYLTDFGFPNQEYHMDFKLLMDQALRIFQVK